MGKKTKKIKVKITKSSGWYKKDEIHKVNNYVTFGFCGNEASFEVGKGVYGISLKDCVVLSESESIPEYTIDELTDKIGHNFKIKRS